MNNKKFQAIENIVAATATYAKTLIDVESVIKFADIEKTCELLDIKEFMTNIQLIRSIININNNNSDDDDDKDDVNSDATPIAEVALTTEPVIEKATETINQDIDLSCEFISYDKPRVIECSKKTLNLMGKEYRAVRVSALDHMLLVREDGAIFDHLGNQLIVSDYAKGQGNKIKVTMPNGRMTYISAIPIVAHAWVEKKRKCDLYPRIVDPRKPVTPDNIIWYDRKTGPVKVPPEYTVSTTPLSTINRKYIKKTDDTTTAEKKKKTATSISYSIEYEIPVIRQLNRYRGSIKKVYDELKDQGSSVTLFDIFNIKEDKFGTTDDDLSVLVRDVVEDCHYDMNRIGDLILKNTNKLISHTQRRLIRKMAKKAGVEVVEETEKFPEVKKIDQKNERELEISNVLKRLDWNILQAFLHMRATPTPATMFQIYKVKEKYYSTDESDVRAVAINIHRSMGISDWKKISEMLDKEIGVTINPEKIESWIDSYNNYIQRKRGEAPSAK